MHHPVAIAYVLRPDLLELRPARVEIDCSWGISRGRTNVDLRQRTRATPNAKVAVNIDSSGFIRLLVAGIRSLR